MHLLAEIEGMFLLDGFACALLAAAAVCRARSFGAHITGALALGSFCGLLGPLLREAFLHGSQSTTAILSQFPADALLGAAGGLAAIHILAKFSRQTFFWLDAASIGLAASVGSLLALPEAGIVGALSLGLVNGLAPGLVRDVALGDTAMLIDQSWYATAAAIGSLVAIAVLMWLAVGWVTEWTASHADETAALAGFCVVMLIRGCRVNKAS